MATRRERMPDGKVHICEHLREVPDGPHLLGGETAPEHGAALRELFMQRVLAPPVRQ